MSVQEKEALDAIGFSPLYPGQYDSEMTRGVKISEESTRRMNDGMVHNWNSRVKPNDVVYHLGDFSYGDDHDALSYLKRLNGQIHFIEGNHDHQAATFKHEFASYQAVKLIKVYGQWIWLSHYAHRSWPHSHRGSWNLYGHTHGTIPNIKNSIDVGVDSWNFFPISFEEIQTEMKRYA